MLRNAVPAARRERLGVLVAACARIEVLGLDGHGAVDDWQLAPHGEGGRLAQLQVVVFLRVVFVGSWHLERLQRNVSSVGQLLPAQVQRESFARGLVFVEDGLDVVSGGGGRGGEVFGEVALLAVADGSAWLSEGGGDVVDAVAAGWYEAY